MSLLTDFVYLVYAHYRYEFFCPKCGKRIAIALSAFILGPGWRRCRKCGEVIRDGSREWDELARRNRLEYLLSDAMLHYFIFAGIASAVTAVRLDDWREARTTVTWLALASVIILVASFAFKAPASSRVSGTLCMAGQRIVTQPQLVNCFRRK
jgi:hypothetical protein